MNDIRQPVTILPKYLVLIKKAIIEQGFQEEDFNLPEFGQEIIFHTIDGIHRMSIEYKHQTKFYIRFNQLGDLTVGGMPHRLNEIHYEFYPCISHHEPHAGISKSYYDLILQFQHWLKALKQNVPPTSIAGPAKPRIKESITITPIKVEYQVITEAEKQDNRLNTIIELLKKKQVPVPFSQLLEHIKDMNIFQPVGQLSPEENYYSNALLTCNYVLEKDGVIQFENEGKRDPHGWIRLLKPQQVYGKQKVNSYDSFKKWVEKHNIVLQFLGWIVGVGLAVLGIYASIK